MNQTIVLSKYRIVKIPDNSIVAIADDPKWQSQDYVDMVFESLKKKTKRDWFNQHAYNCLPLIIGNQYGFVVKSLYTFDVTWNGGSEKKDVKVTIDENTNETWNLQNISSHFGMGTITIQTNYQLRTPPGINLITTNPPNHFIDGIYHLTGVIETDNLRRDFTFNLRVTRPNCKIHIKKGDYIGCVMPYPRHFIDTYTIESADSVLTESEIREERKSAHQLGVERRTVDIHKKGRNGKRYWSGCDYQDNKFEDHQQRLDNTPSKCPFSKLKK